MQTNSSLTQSWTKIGQIEAKKGLYNLKHLFSRPKADASSHVFHLPKALANSSKDVHKLADIEQHLWHFRLGHPSDARFAVISADRKSTRLNSSHRSLSRMPSSA